MPRAVVITHAPASAQPSRPAPPERVLTIPILYEEAETHLRHFILRRHIPASELAVVDALTGQRLAWTVTF